MNLKNIILKSVATTMAISIIFGNISVGGIGISKAIAEDSNVPDINIELQNEKYVQYKEETHAGVAVSSRLSIYSNQMNENYLPIESVNLEINLPKLNGCFPERATVVEGKTKATTGEELNTSIDQNYDTNSGLLTVSYENTKNGNESIYTDFNKDAKDDFEIIYIYPEQAYNGNTEEVSLQYIVKAKITFITKNKEVKSEKTKSFEFKEKANKGNIAAFDAAELKEKIYKGFMYSNVENKTNYDTEYKTVSTLCVLNSQVVDDLTMELKESKFVLNDEEETEVSSNENVIYKATGINKEEFDRMLGQEGALEIYNGEELIATVKYVETNEGKKAVKKLAVVYSEEDIRMLSNEETTAVVEYKDNTKNIKIKISKPISEGFIHFENQNVIKASENYGSKVEKIKYLSTESKINEESKTVRMELLEPETRISVTSSNNNFSTLQTSKTTLTIKLDDTNASTKLFDNPSISVKLPKGLIGGHLSSPEILNGNGLSIKTAKADNNVITINLEGKQTAYDLNNVSGGVNIVMDIEDIDFSDTIPTHQDKIEVNCVQGNNKLTTSCEVNIVSKEGLLMLTEFSGYDGDEKITTINSNLQEIQIDEESDKKELTEEITLVNNYEKDINDLKLIGNLSYSNSTFATILNKGIQVNNKNAKVYYSSNKDAAYDDDSWTTEFTNQAKVYKVVMPNNTLAAKTSLKITAYMELQNNIGYNQASYIKVEANYTINNQKQNDSSTIGLTTKINDIEKMQTRNTQILKTKGNENPITLTVTPLLTQNVVHSNQIVTYKIKAINNGIQDLENITIDYTVPDSEIYTYKEIVQQDFVDSIETFTNENQKQIHWNVNSLKAGETREFELLLTMKPVPSDTQIDNIFSLNYEGQKLTQTSTLMLKPAKISAQLIVDEEKMPDRAFEAEEEIEIEILVKNESEEKLKNIEISYTPDENLTFIDGGEAEYDEEEGYIIKKQGKFDNDKKEFKYNISSLNKQESKNIIIKAKVNRLTNVYEANITNIAKVHINDDIYETNVTTIKTKQTAFNISMNVDTQGQTIPKSGDIIIYNIQVENIGATERGFIIKDKIPEQLETLSIEYEKNNEEKNKYETSIQELEIDATLGIKEKMNIKITTKVRDAEENTNVTIENFATFSSATINANTNIVKSNIKLINPNDLTYEDTNGDEYIKEEQDKEEEIEYEDSEININNTPTEIKEDDDYKGEVYNPGQTEKPNNPDSGDKNPDQTEDIDNPQQEKKNYSISGLAWLDNNKNGQRDSDEKLMDSVIVTLINKETGDYAKNAEGKNLTTVTNSNGEYKFENIKEGNYIVLFEFDTNTYTVTTYQKSEIEKNLNSDAIITTISIDGNKKIAGITDSINLNTNKENIDIGLIENATFDLSLEKNITKVSVINSQGTQEFNYKDGDTAKVDLVAKYINSATVIVTYKFTIKNEGDTVGYVDSLVDNLPSGLEFSSELNKDWYKGSDGQIYTTSLSGIAINPGQTSEIELVLTKNMTENNTGVFTNNAKLEKISNLENIQEKEEALENNESSAILVISIKTGSAMLYTGITLCCITIIAAGAYIIKKKILDKKI